MPDTSSLYVLAAGYHTQLLDHEQVAVEELLLGYRAAERRVVAKIAKFERDYARALQRGEYTRTWAQQERHYQGILSQIEAEVEALSNRAFAATRSAQLFNANLGISSTRTMIELQGTVTSTFVGVHHQAIAQMVRSMADGTPLDEYFRTLGPLARANARDILVSGLATGDNPRSVGRRLATALNITVDSATVTARTETLRAYRLAQAETYRQNRSLVTGWRWLSARDERTCPICIAMDGTIHEVDEPFVSHICCRCTTVPVLRYGDTDIGLGADWFDAQDETMQRDILMSPGRYDAYKRGVPLRGMVKRTFNPRWGDSLALVPIRDLP